MSNKRYNIIYKDEELVNSMIDAVLELMLNTDNSILMILL
jgi:hypothetical protein